MSDVPPPPPPGRPDQGGSPVPPPPPPGLQPPPGYVAYGAAPTPTARVNRIGGLSKAIVILVGIAAAITVFVAVLSPSAADSARDFIDGNISESQFQDDVLAYNLIQGATGVVTLAAMVVVMIWMYRIAANIRAFGTSTTWHPLWAIFGWFLPPVLYIIPLLMLRELWRKSVNTVGPASSSGTENLSLYVWFLLFSAIPTALAVLQASSFADQFSAQGADAQAQALVDAGSLTVINAVVTIGAAAAWIIFVRQLHDRHIALTGER